MPFLAYVAPLISFWFKYKIFRVTFLFAFASLLIYVYNSVFEYFLNYIFKHLDITNYLTGNSLYVFINSGFLQSISTYFSIVLAWNSFVIALRIFTNFMSKS